MRPLILAVTVLLGGCALGSDLYSSLPSNSDEQLDFIETQAAYKRLVTQSYKGLLKDHAPVETPYISSLRKTHPIEPGDWIACLKDDNSLSPRTFAVFFQNAKIVDLRLAVLIDECDGQAYEPLLEAQAGKAQ